MEIKKMVSIFWYFARFSLSLSPIYSINLIINVHLRSKMKKLNIISMALCAMMGTATLTSCEGTLDDVFGEWSRPTKTEPTLSIEETPLTIEAVEAGTIRVVYAKGMTLPKPITYTKNGVSTSITATTEITVAAGDVVSFSSENSTLYDGTNYAYIRTDLKCYVYGNVMSMINDEGDFSKDKTISGDYALVFLLSLNKNMCNHPDKKLILPASTLSMGCYYGLFYGCHSLASAPELPATTLTQECYYEMFFNCPALTTAPALPATTLATECYYKMFYNCTGLTTAPALPATTLAEKCYYMMFEKCTGLSTAPELPATTLASQCYYGMFYNCTALETAIVLPATTLVDKCYVAMFEGCSKLSSVSCKATSGIDGANLTDWLDNAGTDATSPTLHVTTGKESKSWTLPTTPTWTIKADL